MIVKSNYLNAMNRICLKMLGQSVISYHVQDTTQNAKAGIFIWVVLGK